MGGTSYSSFDHAARTTVRAATAAKTGISTSAATFAHSHGIKTGTIKAAVHSTLSPKGAKVRESRDSAEHPVTYPIGITLDTTGSMATVPEIIQKELSKLMGYFLEERASGKKYLGEAYPAIMISAVDDYPRGERAGCLQASQFESGIELDDSLINLWITGNGGGGEPRESYDLALYFAARHTIHDHLEKRGGKGCWFIIGDEMSYLHVDREQVREVINADPLQDNISIQEIIAEASEKYDIFYVMPNMTSHYKEPRIVDFWKALLPQGHVIMLDDPTKICETIAGCVALSAETGVTLDDLKADGIVTNALVPLSKGAAVGKGSFNASGLPAIAGDPGSTERL